MKKSNLIHRVVCWAMAMALAMLPTLAQHSQQVVTTPDGKKYILASSQPDMRWVDKGDFWIQQPINQIPQKVEENEGTITINYEWDFGDHDASCQSFSYLGQNDHWAQSVFGNSFQIPPGEYDFTSSANEYNTSGYSYYIVVKEKVIINKDTTLVFHIDEASNLIDIADHHPNGELFKYPDNYSAVLVNTGLQRKNDNSYLGIMIPTSFYSGIYNCLYLSPVSDRFKFFQGRIYITEDYGENPQTYVTFYTSDNPSTHMENNETDYVCIKEHFEPSKISVEEAGDKGFGADLHVMFSEENHTNNGLYMWLDSSVSDAEIYVNAPQVNEETLPLHALFSITMIDYLQIVGYFPWGEARYSSRLIKTPWFMTQDGEPLYMHLGLNGTPMNWWYSDGVQVIYPFYHNSHPFFFKDKEKRQDFGSTVPIFAYYDNRPHGVGGVMLGRNGEDRDIDLQLTTNLTLYENGEEVWSGQMLDYGQNAVYSAATGIIEGVYDNQNVIVDGLQGQNITTIHYDASIENDIPPTLTFLWFKDVNGDVNDRLQNASNGILEFSAGDFVPQVNSSTGTSYYTCNPLSSVEVLYSPYQEDDWDELTVEEVPENFCSPGYGYFYRGSLAEVTGQALKGWFDLKVKLTDAAGNWQEQIISPAFRIDELAFTGIATPRSDNAREVARYSIDGKRVDANHRGVTIIRMSDGTARKVLN